MYPNGTSAQEVLSASSDQRPWLVTIGRSNYRKSAAAIDQLLLQLEASGVHVVSFEPKRVRISRNLDAWWSAWCGGRVALWCEHHARVGAVVRKVFKGVRLLFSGDLRALACAIKGSSNEQAAAQLRALLLQWHQSDAHRRVYVLGHSAGALVASMVHDAPNVVGLVGLGYPFKHPDHDEEPIRTRHLGQVSKPFLIVQGELDSYGSPAQAVAYGLSATTRVVSVECTHDYNLTAEQQTLCMQWLNDFLLVGHRG